jgi:hypothetical protein
MKIWKFPLAVADQQYVEMPRGAKLLSVQPQNAGVCLWALCDEHADKVRRVIGIYGTGNPIPDECKTDPFIATFQLHSGALVFHAFDHGEVFR